MNPRLVRTILTMGGIRKIYGVGIFWSFDQISLFIVDGKFSGVIHSAETEEILGLTFQF